MRFYLGTHMPHWLERSERSLFVSHRRLHGRRSLPRARCRWALDSGGFTELSMHGRWATTSLEYIAAARRYRDEVGNLDWCAPQDWMCEPWITAKTGKTVADHQHLTVHNFIELRGTAPDLPFVPVLQGWTLDDYRRCIDLYHDAGVKLADEPLVGLGTVCRRQATDEIGRIVATLAETCRLHGFGVKLAGLRRYGWLLTSADSMAWSYRGRRINPCPHTGVISCANCWMHANEWATRALAGDRPVQLELEDTS